MLTLAELSTLSQKSLPLITSIVYELINEGYVVEHGLVPSTGGRRALAFLLNQEKKRFIVAVAMDQMVAQVVIYDLLNNARHAVEVIALKLADDTSALNKLVSFIKILDGLYR